MSDEVWRDEQVKEYDIVIIGGGMAGCCAALHASRQGAEVLMVESRSFLGREVTATLRPWIGRDGFEAAEENMLRMIGVPSASGPGEVADKAAGHEATGDPVDEIPLSIARVKKGWLNALREAGVQVLFRSETAGVLTAVNRVCGVIVGNKSGLQAILARAVIDATGNGAALRNVQARRAVNSGVSNVYRRTIEWTRAALTDLQAIDVPAELGLADDRLSVHQGSLGDGHVLVEFGFAFGEASATAEEAGADGVAGAAGVAADIDPEISARKLTIRICEHLRTNHPGFQDAVVLQTSGELWGVPQYEAGPSGFTNIFATDTDRLWFAGQNFQALAAMEKAAREAADLALGCLRSMGDATDGAVDAAGIEAHFGELVVPWPELTPDPIRDGSLGIRCYRVAIPLNRELQRKLPVLDSCDIVVAGGGTAGAPAAIGALGEGSRVTVIEGLSGLGGTGTLGGINTYWFGYDGGFSKQLDVQVAEMTRRIGSPTGNKLWNIEAKMMTYLEEIDRIRGRIIFRTIAVDVIREGDRLGGLMVLGPDGLAMITAEFVIDATGDGDIAAMAGIPYTLGDPAGGNIQTFNQCDWKTNGFLAGANVDAGVIDGTDVFDTTRGITIAHGVAGDYDFSPYPAVRESRHIQGQYKLKVADVLAGARFPDTIALGSTDFDQHGLQSSEFARLGYLPYHQGEMTARLPYRCCYNESVANLLVTGKAFSSERDAFSFHRMQRDMQNAGYAIGCAAAMAARDRVPAGQVDLKQLQRKLLDIGIIREEDIDNGAGNAVHEVLGQTVDGREAFLRLICLPRETVLPQLKAEFEQAADAPKKLAVAMALCWFGESTGVEVVIERLRQLDEAERSSNLEPERKPIGGLAREIRRTGHGKRDFDQANADQGKRYWEINGLITLLGLAGLAGDSDSVGILCEIAEQTDAGGSPYDHVRLHWRRVPHYDRIVSLCTSLERLAANSPAGIPAAARALETMIGKPHLGGFIATTGLDAGGNYASAYLELLIARTMARCGSVQGLYVLADYVDDVQAMLARYAYDSLRDITGQSLARNSAAWKLWIDGKQVQAAQSRSRS